jgi:hypothetical protein
VAIEERRAEEDEEVEVWDMGSRAGEGRSWKTKNPLTGEAGGWWGNFGKRLLLFAVLRFARGCVIASPRHHSARPA